MNNPKPDTLLEHSADNDGIEEYDNPLPDWWLGLFLLTILFAFLYPIVYHILGRGQIEEYNHEIELANIQWPTPAAGVIADLSEDTIRKGEAIYQQNCASCHQADLSGKVGPNLMDDIWIHGGTLSEIQHTIENGVPEKGMLTWGPILGPQKIADVAVFVYSKGKKQGLTPKN